MKLLKSISSSPKKFFKSRFARSVSRPGDPNSIGSGSGSSRSSNNNNPRDPAGAVEFPGDELVQAFNLIDRNRDGKIQREELAALFGLLGAEELEIDCVMSEVDRNGDGCISLEEFAALRPAFAAPSRGSEVRDTFELFDADGDGRISAEELYRVLGRIGDGRCTIEECRRMISGVDKNEDGFVCFEDFSRMMEQQIFL
ncbi:unnamed protein product [Cuscuta campestris]|uniref:EF-hand domain-containing protein n=1 Tax=Cuscuta campestris TaxID=132261 RepID=A0A484MT70_9ASTE|nr:unnamed protein product [Cuscuta campestris]